MGEETREWFIDFIEKNYTTASKRVRKDILISLMASLQKDFNPSHPFAINQIEQWELGPRSTWMKSSDEFLGTDKCESGRFSLQI